MPRRQPIPERAPIGDAFSGVIHQVDDDTQILSSMPLADVPILAQGQFVVRYGIRYLGKPHISVVPGLVAIDYGEMLTGEEAWDFLLKRSNLYPRADVLGYRNDGTDEMIVVKWLDMVLTPEVLIYADDSATTPLAKPVALIGEAPDNIPSRLSEYLPQYPTLSAFQENQTDE